MSRSSVALAAGLAAGALLLGPALGAQAAPRPDAAEDAASWLAGQVDDDGLLPGSFPGAPADVGLSIDALFALVAAGAPAEDVAGLGAAVEAAAADWVVYDSPDYYSVSGGSAAKTLLAAEVLGTDPTDFGGLDLPELLSTATDDGSVRSFDRVDGEEGFSGGLNVFNQTLAVMGLARAGELEQTSVDALLPAQCGAGYFMVFPVQGSSCDDEDGEPDRDATAMAVMALLAAGEAGLQGADAPRQAAVEWLLADQGDSGGFGGGAFTSGLNTNSTGLVAAALQAAGEEAAADRAGAFVVGLQSVGEDQADLAGAIAYDQAAFDAAAADGVDEFGLDQWRRATAQAVLALAPVSLHELELAETDPGAGDPGSGDDDPDPPAEPTPDPEPSPRPDPDPEEGTGSPGGDQDGDRESDQDADQDGAGDNQEQAATDDGPGPAATSHPSDEPTPGPGAPVVGGGPDAGTATSAPLTTSQPAPGPGELARTGAPTGPWLPLGALAAVAAGVGLVVAGRRRRR